MKSFITLTICAIFLGIGNLSAQDKNNATYVYGVDFSNVKVYAADESVEQFAKAFEGINMLLIREPDKYDFSSMVDSKVEMVIDPMLKKLSDCNYEGLITHSQDIGHIDCQDIISNYALTQSEGTGVVFIAKFLNKAANQATYDLVVFDIAKREIISIQEVTGKARGFGLRNFWAGSLYKILKTTKLYN